MPGPRFANLFDGREYTESNGPAPSAPPLQESTPPLQALLLNDSSFETRSAHSSNNSRTNNHGSSFDWFRRGAFSFRDFGSWGGSRYRRWAASGSGLGSLVESSLVDWSANETPYFCYVMTFVCCAIYLWESAVGDWELAPFSENPFIGPSALVLVQCGAQVSGCLLPPSGQWWRLLSAMFLHAGIVHLVANMGALLLIGMPIERAWGSVRIGVVYMVAGISAAFSTALMIPDSVAVGASGAIMGLIGIEWADLLVNWRSWKHTGERRSELVRLLIPTVWTVILGVFPYINFFAHASGLLTALLLSLPLFIRTRYTRWGEPKEPLPLQWYMAAAGAAALVLLLGLQCGLLYRVDSVLDLCRDCNFLCIDTPWWDCKAADEVYCDYTVDDEDLVTSLTCFDGESKNTSAFSPTPTNSTDFNTLFRMCEALCSFYCEVA